MLKCKFIGTSDHNFTNGNTYTMVRFEDDTHGLKLGYFRTWFINDNNSIKYIPYSNLNTFNYNWEVEE